MLSFAMFNRRARKVFNMKEFVKRHPQASGRKVIDLALRNFA